MAVNVLMAVLTYRQYQDMLEYCSGFSREGLECLGAYGSRPWQVWKAIGFEVSLWVLFELTVLVVLGAASVNRPRSRPSAEAR